MAREFTSFITKVQRKLDQNIKKLPGIIKVEGLQFIGDNFQKQGFETKKGTYTKWPEKKTINRSSPGNQATLVSTGRLRRSWQSESTADAHKVVFRSSTPYAAVHNEGLRAGKPPGFTMPQRQMIGESPALNSRVESKVDMVMKKIFT